MVTLCIPCLTRYDLLKKCIASAEEGTLKPDKYLVIDNGRNLNWSHDKMTIHTPETNLGVAGSWNWFIKNASEHRIIVNDDVEFYPDSIEKIVAKLEEGPEFVWTFRPGHNGFSCFAVKDSVIRKIGIFDEAISPHYAYFEDNDFMHRMNMAGIPATDSEALMKHEHSSTLHSFNAQQTAEHHIKFHRAQQNYAYKWGGAPHKETINTPYDSDLATRSYLDTI